MLLYGTKIKSYHMDIMSKVGKSIVILIFNLNFEVLEGT